MHHIRITMSDVDVADYNGEDIAEQARISETDRLYDNPDNTVSYQIGITRGIC
jgi:hypothetical protein